ncbi:hypothetical protein GCM10011399_00130 [Subtercola lobariae]|uniref:Uncharacterized protein n=1 Tax=Subtercola lobariae TaxID=1588641 RepID=A0A917AZY1_9MICO|nr:hypothetical protein GCM10011399_00130 [Subtercola lobariae]
MPAALVASKAGPGAVKVGAVSAAASWLVAAAIPAVAGIAEPVGLPAAWLAELHPASTTRLAAATARAAVIRDDRGMRGFSILR